MVSMWVFGGTFLLRDNCLFHLPSPSQQQQKKNHTIVQEARDFPILEIRDNELL